MGPIGQLGRPPRNRPRSDSGRRRCVTGPWGHPVIPAATTSRNKLARMLSSVYLAPPFAIRVSRTTFGIYENPEASLKLNSSSATVPIGQPESRGRKRDAERAVAIDSRTYGRSEHEDRSMGFARVSGSRQCRLRDRRGDRSAPNLSPPSRIRGSSWTDRNDTRFWVRTCSSGSPSSQFHSAPSVSRFGALELGIDLLRRWRGRGKARAPPSWIASREEGTRAIYLGMEG